MNSILWKTESYSQSGSVGVRSLAQINVRLLQWFAFYFGNYSQTTKSYSLVLDSFFTTSSRDIQCRWILLSKFGIVLGTICWKLGLVVGYNNVQTSSMNLGAIYCRITINDYSNCTSGKSYHDIILNAENSSSNGASPGGKENQDPPCHGILPHHVRGFCIRFKEGGPLVGETN